ncbi:unnamed protein product [Cylicocyclus nassatus]|uniref:Nucleoporin NDC1 n=1 Tax=Cylicocyclus nassatus TaxID=53992 RepID=A0AA36GKF1_CYLNA|nr:unnamed protein product [Cylicocyclus nassatus]
MSRVMTGEFTPPSIGHNEAASSPLSQGRRSTFDDDAFFSAPRTKSEARTVRPQSPQQAKLPTVHDKILFWFRGLISVRQMRVSLIVGLICAFTYIVSLIALQFSLLSPLQFFRDAVSTLFAFSTWFSAIVVGFASFVMSRILLSMLVKAEQPQRLPWKSGDTWLGYLVVLIYNTIYTGIILKMSYAPQMDSIFLGSLVLSLVISTLFSIFRNDFQMSFSGSVAQLGVSHSISTLFYFGRDSLIASAFREAVRVVLITIFSSCVIGCFTHGLSTLLFLFHISFHLYCLIVVFGQIFATKVLLKLNRQLVMKPMTFLLPPPFVVHTPTPEQTRTLTNVLDSQDSLLKLFAFTDLRRIAWTDQARRLEVFSLSQPGGHPRNWSNICTTCINILERVRSEIEGASSRLFGGPSIDGSTGDVLGEEQMEVDREMLMMPQKSRKQLYSSAVRQRHRVAMRPMTRRSEISIPQQFTWLKKIYALFADEACVIPRFDAYIAVLAIESLYMFVVESYQEDRYGVVLKDLANIIGVFVHLIQAIDKFFRLKANQTVNTCSDASIRQIDAALQAGLLRINGKFGAHLSALNLTREQLQTIKMVCQSDM